ncbi:hypothetical protein [Kordia sp.]|uniref:hypothetical protein n=1 Tax=Kordia sp. TaxID=1965332 RepID=UPI003B5BAB3B
MRYYKIFIVFSMFIIISSGMTSCTPDSIAEEQNTTEVFSTEPESENPLPPSEETGEDDELEPNS